MLLRGALSIFLFALILNVNASVEKGFKALSIHDYFLAKKCFYKKNRKAPDPYASYGLASIYSRNNNPFFNIDSASKYAALSYNAFKVKGKIIELSGYKIDSGAILKLCDTIAFKHWRIIRNEKNAEAFNDFLIKNYTANALLKEQAVYLRDEIEYNEILAVNKSGTTQQFINTHPQSFFLSEAFLLIQRQVYEEQTEDGTKEKYIRFIQNHQSNRMINSAYESLYKIYREDSDVDGLRSFVTNYKDAPQFNEAWKLLFSLTVTSFSNAELEKFLEAYPSFPFKNSILRELELNKIKLYPYESNDLIGFVDSSAKKVIVPEYDATTGFCEGLAVVNKNDSVFYINKENVNPFNRFYNEAFVFKNGIAAVKENDKWAFINRQGQVIKGDYEEINELSEGMYVIKSSGKYGAVNHLGQILIEPRFEKLGDFKNEFAYYIEKGKYGFVSKTGSVHKAEFEWISDFSEYKNALIKQNNLYGIINSQGQVILPADYDLILKATNNIFVVIKNNLYGFYNGSGCFISAVSYDFLKEKPVEYYTNGKAFKLLKKGEQGFADANGKLIIDFGVYDEINFASNDLIKVKRKNKYGFVGRKLSLIIPYKYDEATDFTDSVAIVMLKEKSLIINTRGKEVYGSEERIEKLSEHFYVVGNEAREIVNWRGEKLLTGVADIQKADKGTFIITLVNKEIKLLRD